MQGGLIGLLLSSPTYGIYNTEADPTRLLGWLLAWSLRRWLLARYP